MKTLFVLFVIIGLAFYWANKVLDEAPTIPPGDDPDYFPFYDDEAQP